MVADDDARRRAFKVVALIEQAARRRSHTESGKEIAGNKQTAQLASPAFRVHAQFGRYECCHIRKNIPFALELLEKR